MNIHIYNKHVGVPRISPLKQLNIMGKKFQRHPFDILQEIMECLIFDHLPLNRIRYCSAQSPAVGLVLFEKTAEMTHLDFDFIFEPKNLNYILIINMVSNQIGVKQCRPKMSAV